MNGFQVYSKKALNAIKIDIAAPMLWYNHGMLRITALLPYIWWFWGYIGRFRAIMGI
tara:strand:- start:546 stop:716 length:171 start_codon:yes stop_codon:yes gene_type:complete